MKVYHFQFNSDEASCVALLSIVKDGWSFTGKSYQDGGFSFFVLEKIIK